MEEKPSASEADAVAPDSFPAPSRAPTRRLRHVGFSPLGVQDRGFPNSSRLSIPAVCLSFLIAFVGPLNHPVARGDSLARVRTSGLLRYGSDMEGGGPYAYPDPRSPREVTGFEVELMGRLAADLGASAVFSQGQWDKLLQVLDSGRIDLVVNGYEWTEPRAREYLATRPYYVYQLKLMVRRGSAIRSWADLKNPKPGGGRWTVGVLVGSAADTFAAEQGAPHVSVIRFDGATDAMTAVANGQYDATLQDLPAATFYQDRFPRLCRSVRPSRTVTM